MGQGGGVGDRRRDCIGQTEAVPAIFQPEPAGLPVPHKAGVGAGDPLLPGAVQQAEFPVPADGGKAVQKGTGRGRLLAGGLGGVTVGAFIAGGGHLVAGAVQVAPAPVPLGNSQGFMAKRQGCLVALVVQRGAVRQAVAVGGVAAFGQKDALLAFTQNGVPGGEQAIVVRRQGRGNVGGGAGTGAAAVVTQALQVGQPVKLLVVPAVAVAQVPAAQAAQLCIQFTVAVGGWLAAFHVPGGVVVCS